MKARKASNTPRACTPKTVTPTRMTPNITMPMRSIMSMPAS